MYQPIEDNLEDYLSGKATPDQLRAMESVMEGSDEARQVVVGMEQQALLLRTLRAGADVEPAPGFYARVMARIDAQRPISFWSFFLDPFFGKRLFYASLALFVLLSIIGIGTESGNSTVTAGTNPVGVMAEHEYPPTPGIDQQHDRDVVLVNLATWGGGGDQEDHPLPADSQ